MNTLVLHCTQLVAKVCCAHGGAGDRAQSPAVAGFAESICSSTARSGLHMRTAL